VPLILSVVCFGCMNRNDRLEMDMTANVQGIAQQRYSFNVSYKKHAVSSYKTNWAPPPTADINTLVNMSENEFMLAFNEYGRVLSTKMQGQESTTFSPSAPMNRVTTRGIAFSSDVNNLGGNVHCFPFTLSPVQTPKCISLNRASFNHFKIVAQFLYRTGNVNQAGALASWNAIEGLVRGRSGQPNELLSDAEIQALEVRLRGGGNLQRMINAEAGAIRRAENLGARPNPQPNRPPFRSGW
jgi:hypothetical protein